MTKVLKKETTEHLHGNLFRVLLSEIKFAENQSDSQVFTFSNPRHVLSGKPKGFGKEEMTELREAIRTEGLKDPLLLRWTDINGIPTLQLVAGERRTRSLQKLVADKAKCWDAGEEAWKCATELYEYVDCRINNLDDKTAFKHAFSDNERAIGIGEGANIALIRDFRRANWSDAEILEVTGKSVSWLRDTDTLIDLDDDTFQALAQDSINRSAALELAKIEDVEERLSILEAAKNCAMARLKEVKTKIEKEVEKAEDKLQVAEALIVESELTDDEEIAEGLLEEATEQIESLNNRIETKLADKQEIEAEIADPKINGSDLKRARRTAGNANAGGGGTSLTRAKIEKFWYAPIQEVIKADGADAEGNDLLIDLEDARLVKSLCEHIEKGDTDIVKILKTHRKAKDKRAGI